MNHWDLIHEAIGRLTRDPSPYWAARVEDALRTKEPRSRLESGIQQAKHYSVRLPLFIFNPAVAPPPVVTGGFPELPFGGHAGGWEFEAQNQVLLETAASRARKREREEDQGAAYGMGLEE